MFDEASTNIPYMSALVPMTVSLHAAAADSPRLHHQLMPMRVQYQAEFPPDMVQDLRSRGHVAVPYTSAGSEVRTRDLARAN